jgi:hypothetical protein
MFIHLVFSDSNANNARLSDAPSIFAQIFLSAAQTVQFVPARVNPRECWQKTELKRVFHAPYCCARPSVFFQTSIFYAAALGIFSKSLLAAALARKTEQKHFYSLESN